MGHSTRGMRLASVRSSSSSSSGGNPSHESRAFTVPRYELAPRPRNSSSSRALRYTRVSSCAMAAIRPRWSMWKCVANTSVRAMSTRRSCSAERSTSYDASWLTPVSTSRLRSSVAMR